MQQQSGSILTVVLVICLLASLLIQQTVENSILAIRSQHNYLEKNLTLAQAENAATDAKNWLNALSTSPLIIAQCKDNFCITSFYKDEPLNNKQLSWWETHASKINNAYVKIRLLDTKTTTTEIINYYQITSYANTENQAAYTILQTVMLKKFSLTPPFTAIPCQQLSWTQLT